MHTRGFLLAVALLLPLSGITADTEGDEVGVSLRQRFEFVDDDNFDEKAKASTVLFRINYKTRSWQQWTAFVEFDYVAELGLDEFNSGAGTSSPARDIYPVVADPTGADLNQILIQRPLGDRGLFRLGRQRIIFDNQRFVGGVGWRQNEQTYDGLSVQYDFTPELQGYYAYVANVNRIFGNDVPAGDHNNNTHLAEARWTTDLGRITGYGYFIDNEDVPAFSTRTVGVSWTGNRELGENTAHWRAQYARQDDYGNNPVAYDADYWRLDGKLAFPALTVGAGYEVLGGADIHGAAFITPLATLHAFNGLADRFLATPDDGLEDRFLSAGGKVGAFSWSVVWHDFEANDSSDDLGTEIDASISTAFGPEKRYGVLLAVADFNGQDGPADTQRTWLQFKAAF